MRRDVIVRQAINGDGKALVWPSEENNPWCFDSDSGGSDDLLALQFPEDTVLLNENKKKNDGANNDGGLFPKSIFFIVGNEFCERFTFYGLRAVLTLYFKSVLHYNDHEAIELYHGFAFFCYFTPVFGAILADGFLGKFRTIFYISIVYAIGNVILSLSTIDVLHLPQEAFSIFGLMLIAIGTGGIKPCVSAFGGDQFEENQQTQLQTFFSVFYFSVNAGSLISFFVTPIFRADVHCFGRDSCFPLAFGVPAALMFVALVFFLVGKPWYKIRPAKGAVITDFFKCIFHAVRKRVASLSSSKPKKSHWLDYASDRFDVKFIDSVKAVMSVLVLFIPIPFFWALFDQQGSRWIIQATFLNGRIPGTSFYLLPDQMGMLNPILILSFIPLFDFLIYPAFQKIGLLKNSLQRICVGGFIAAIAYVIAGILQIQIESTLPASPAPGYTQLRFVNAAPCNISISTDFMSAKLEPNNFHLSQNDIEARLYNIEVTVNNCPILNGVTRNYTQSFRSGEIYSVIVGLNRNAPTYKPQLTLLQANDTLVKSASGKSLLSISYFLPSVEANSSFGTSEKDINFDLPNTKDNFGSTKFDSSDPGKFKLYLPENLRKNFSSPIIDTVIGPGSIHRIVVTSKPNPSKHDDINTFMYTIVEENEIHISWQLPQYFVITAGEIMLSITGLKFSYTQAPKAMTSVLTAAWLLTVSFGNCIVLIMELIGTLPKESDEYFLFSGLMAVDMIIFAILAYFYKYVNFDDEEPQKTIEAQPDPNASTSL